MTGPPGVSDASPPHRPGVFSTLVRPMIAPAAGCADSVSRMPVQLKPASARRNGPVASLVENSDTVLFDSQPSQKR
jgi:hypothetical protein